MLDKLLADHKDELITAVTSKLGVGTDQAGTFIQKLLDMAQKLIGKGDLDLSALLKGDVGALKSKLNLDVLGSALGGGADKAEQECSEERSARDHAGTIACNAAGIKWRRAQGV